MTTPTDVERAERISRRRARMFPILGVYFIAGQAIFFNHNDVSQRIAQFKISAWLVWALVLLIAFAFAGGHFQGKKIRALVEDDVARANRAKAYETGFWAAATAAIALYITNMFEVVTGRDAIHLILTALVGAAMIRFGTLERRALKEG
jgi:protein-S-isoprenylcysteine O-methyltransferase Ste14